MADNFVTRNIGCDFILNATKPLLFPKKGWSLHNRQLAASRNSVLVIYPCLPGLLVFVFLIKLIKMAR